MPTASRQLSTRQTLRRGVAEIECLFCIFILMGILFLTIGLANLGVARIQAIAEAEHMALGNAATGDVPNYTGNSDLTEVTTEWDIRPGLPNRTHVARVDKEVSIFTSGGDDTLPPTKIHAIAGAISPTWMLAAYPAVNDDAQPTQSWFEEFIEESHADLVAPLMLAPAWLP